MTVCRVNSSFGGGGVGSAKVADGRRRGKGRLIARRQLSRHDPLLVTWKRAKGLGSLRRKKEASVIFEAIKAARKQSCRIIHFSIQADHIHLLIEADDRRALVRGMSGLGCRLGRGLNKLWHRSGKVFAGRFHERVLKNLKQVRNALRYVLNSHHKHRELARPDRPNPLSTGGYFDGWSDFPQRRDPAQAGSYVWPPGSKLGVGWREHYRAFPLAYVPS